MDTPNKKKFPKIQKSLSGFLTPESKKTMRNLTANTLITGAMLIGQTNDVNANTTHANYQPSGCDVAKYNYTIEYDGGSSQCTVGHSSGLINGHFSGTAGHTLNTNLGGVSHVSGSSWVDPCPRKKKCCTLNTATIF